MRKVVLTGLLAFTISLVSAQKNNVIIYSHGNFWGRFILTDKITEKIRWEAFGQLRTQNVFKGANIFEAYQLHSYWAWLHYNPNPALRISVSPFCYFQTQRLYAKPSDLHQRPIKEFRWAARIETTHKFKFVNFSTRYGMEMRYRDIPAKNNYKLNYRARIMGRLTKPVKAEWLHGRGLNLIAYSEVLLQFGEKLNIDYTLFDQSRLFIGFNYEIIKNIKLEVGYLNVLQQRRSVIEFDRQNALWFTITLDNVFSQFKKKEETSEEKK